MSTYVGSRGGVYRGNAPAEDCEAMERWRARCELGAEVRAARERMEELLAEVRARKALHPRLR